MTIFLNGRQMEIDKNKTVWDLKEMYDKNFDVTIVNGFQTNENIVLEQNDRISFIKKGVIPPQEELEELMMTRHTPDVHNKLKKAKVAIAGLGGLGSNIAVMLTRIGVGTLLLVDFDVVEPSNLNRQSYYIKHLGMKKTDALKQQILEINPFICIKTEAVKVEEDSIETLFHDYEIICEAFDNPFYKALLVNGLLEKFPETKIVASSGMAGFESSNLIQTYQKFKNLYVCGDLKTSAEIGRGLMSPRVNICAGHQANMVLRLIVGMEEV